VQTCALPISDIRAVDLVLGRRPTRGHRARPSGVAKHRRSRSALPRPPYTGALRDGDATGDARDDGRIDSLRARSRTSAGVHPRGGGLRSRPHLLPPDRRRPGGIPRVLEGGDRARGGKAPLAGPPPDTYPEDPWLGPGRSPMDPRSPGPYGERP